MSGLADFWWGLLRERHRELLREASRERLVKESRRTREGDREDGRAGRSGAPGVTDERAIVRRGTDLDAPKIAVLLELNGMPRWVAFEERFIVAEEGGALRAAVRFREEPGRLHLGLLVTDPWAEERRLAAALYSGARATARGLGLREVSARTGRHEGPLREAGYRRLGGVWRTRS